MQFLEICFKVEAVILSSVNMTHFFCFILFMANFFSFFYSRFDFFFFGGAGNLKEMPHICKANALLLKYSP